MTDYYPNDEDLKRVKEWPPEDYPALMEFLRERWWAAEMGYFTKQETIPYEPLAQLTAIYHLSTAGWSGNESFISAMQENYLFWSLCWYSSRRGGHYEFRIPLP